MYLINKKQKKQCKQLITSAYTVLRRSERKLRCGSSHTGQHVTVTALNEGSAHISFTKVMRSTVVHPWKNIHMSFSHIMIALCGATSKACHFIMNKASFLSFRRNVLLWGVFTEPFNCVCARLSWAKRKSLSYLHNALMMKGSLITFSCILSQVEWWYAPLTQLQVNGRTDQPKQNQWLCPSQRCLFDKWLRFLVMQTRAWSRVGPEPFAVTDCTWF